MAEIQLRDVPPEHIPIQTRWQVATLSARDSLVLTEADVGGVCLVRSPPGFYDLRAVNPAVVWDRRATDGDLAARDSAIAANTAAIASTSSAATATQAQLDALAPDVDANTAAIAANTAAIAALEARIAALEAGGGGGPPPTADVVLVFLGIGESGMTGIGSLSDPVPAGYPSIAGDFSFFSQSGIEQLPAGPQNEQGPTPPYPVLSEASGYGWCQFALNAKRADYAPRPIRFVPCGASGTTSTQWGFSLNTSTLCGAAIATLKAALAEPGTVWAGLFIDQGYNDIAFHTVPGWAARWTAIVNGIFAEMGKTVPIYYRRFQTETPGAWDPGEVADLLAEQDSWASTDPVRRPCISPNGMSPDNLHLSTAGNILYGEGAVVDAMEAFPPVLQGTVAHVPTKTSPAALGAVAWWRIQDAAPSSWVDSIGGHTLTQATPGKRPTLVADAGAGKPGLLFDRTSQTSMHFSAAFAALFNGAQPYTVLFSFRQTDTQPGIYWSVSKVAERMELALGWLGDSSRASNYRTVLGTTHVQLSRPGIFQENVPTVHGRSWGGALGTGYVYVNGMWTRLVDDPHDAADAFVGLDDGGIGCFTLLGGESFHVSGYAGDIAVFTSQLTPAQARAASLFLHDVAP